MATGVTTQWQDIHVKLGNYVARPHSPTMKQLSQQNLKAAQGFNPLEDKKLAQLEENEDQFQDDQFFKKYRQQRMAQLKENAKQAKFGTVRQIVKSDYTRQVNEAQQECHLLNQMMIEKAKQHPQIKFLKIIASKCIEGFKDQNCPSIIIYKDGNIIKQSAPAGPQLGGKRMNMLTFEWYLAQSGVIKTNLQQDPKKKLVQQRIKIKKGKWEDDDQQEDHTDDREFSWV